MLYLSYTFHLIEKQSVQTKFSHINTGTHRVQLCKHKQSKLDTAPNQETREVRNQTNRGTHSESRPVTVPSPVLSDLIVQNKMQLHGM